MSLRNDIVRFWFWGYRGGIKTELQAPVVKRVCTVETRTLYVQEVLFRAIESATYRETDIK